MARRPEQRDAPGRPVVRPRYGRMAAAGGSVLVTVVAGLGGLGVLPSQPAAAQLRGGGHIAQAPTSDQAPDGGSTPSSAEAAAGRSGQAVRSAGALALMAKPESARGDEPASTPLPAHSGQGRRIVFDMANQRVWLVQPSGKASKDDVRRTYLVSGSVTDNLRAGTYAVYSKSVHAVGIEDSGTMQWMVRFAHGDNAAIGFHDIPVSHGRLVQTRSELGTPRSHGCIRQAEPDARALWRFAPVGTKVVVL